MTDTDRIDDIRRYVEQVGGEVAERVGFETDETMGSTMRWLTGASIALGVSVDRMLRSNLPIERLIAT